MRLAIKYSTYQYHVKIGCHSKVFYKKTKSDNMQDEKTAHRCWCWCIAWRWCAFSCSGSQKFATKISNCRNNIKKIRTCLYQSNFLSIKYLFFIILSSPRIHSTDVNHSNHRNTSILWQRSTRFGVAAAMALVWAYCHSSTLIPT